MARKRLRVGTEGSLKLSEELRGELGWTTGSYLEYEVKGERLEIWKVEVDLFAEAMKKPDKDALDKALERQAENRTAAFEDFEEKMKNPPEVRPEDRPDFWD